MRFAGTNKQSNTYQDEVQIDLIAQRQCSYNIPERQQYSESEKYKRKWADSPGNMKKEYYKHIDDYSGQADYKEPFEVTGLQTASAIT